jgi:hypothetical protein
MMAEGVSIFERLGLRRSVSILVHSRQRGIFYGLGRASQALPSMITGN